MTKSARTMCQICEEEFVESLAVDVDDKERSIVLPAGRRTGFDVLPSDLLAALREIEAEIDRRPGDPGRTVHLSERVRCVLAEAERRGGRGR